MPHPHDTKHRAWLSKGHKVMGNLHTPGGMTRIGGPGGTHHGPNSESGEVPKSLFGKSKEYGKPQSRSQRLRRAIHNAPPSGLTRPKKRRWNVPGD